MSRRIDLSGQRFGSLVALEPAGYKPTRWKCQCDCGTVVVVLRSNLRSGSTKRCKQGCSLRVMDETEATLKSDFSGYRAASKRRGFSFSLTFDEFCRLIQSPCYYCGDTGSRDRALYRRVGAGRVRLNGIDRIDNTVGYTTGNSVSCCSRCNYGKRTDSQIDFLEWVKKVYTHRIAK